MCSRSSQPSVAFYLLLSAGRLTTAIIQVTTVETYPQMIGYDTEVYEYVKEQYARSTLSFPPP